MKGMLVNTQNEMADRQNHSLPAGMQASPSDHRPISITEISFDRSASQFRFVQGGYMVMMPIECDDVAAFDLMSENEEPLIEFRVAHDVSSRPWRMFVGEGCDGDGQWQRGHLFQRQSPTFVRPKSDRTLLGEVGAFASTFRHDLRQPIATISMAAHNGVAHLRNGDVAKALARFELIQAQVDRSEEMFRLNGRATAVPDAPDTMTDIGRATDMAVCEARLMLVYHDVRLHMAADLRGYRTRLPEGGLTALLGELIRQSVSAVLSRRASGPAGGGEIRLYSVRHAAGSDLVLEDDGLHSGDVAAGDSLAMSLAREMMVRAGGMLTILRSDRDGRELSFRFPPSLS